MKFFGKELFGYKEPQDPNLYDFAQHGLVNSDRFMTISADIELESMGLATSGKKKAKKKAVTPQPEITPKELHELKALNENEFKIAVDKDYIAGHVADMKDRLNLFKKEVKNSNNGNPPGIWFGPSGAEIYGKKEVESMIERLTNRLRIDEFKDIVDEFPHTSSLKINQVLEQHKHLRCDTAGRFVPDFPKEATQAMKRYNEMCQKLCGKDTNFYVIAKKADFERVPSKRDPILLAQSPFGFFWQILGAWDEEMEYLGDL